MQVHRFDANRCKESGQGRDRTADTRIFSPVLYRLSYLSEKHSATRQQQNGAVQVDDEALSGGEL